MNKAISLLEELKVSRNYDGNLEHKLNIALEELKSANETIRQLRMSLSYPSGISNYEYKEYWREHLNKILG